MEEKKDSSKKIKFILWIIILLLLVSNLYTLYHIKEQKKVIQNISKENNNIAFEREKLKSDLESMLNKYDSLKKANNTLSSEMAMQQEKIKELLKQVEKHKNDAYLIYKLKKEAETLRKVMKHYVHTIDSLNTLNKTLIKEKEIVTEQLHKKEKENILLIKEKEELNKKIKIASKLSTENFIVKALKLKNNNTGKEVKRAKKTDIIKTCFTIAENKVTKPGEKWIYLRIITPDGNILTESKDKDHLFEFEGAKGYYSVKQKINYNNTKQDVCLSWKKEEDFIEGKYLIKAYVDGFEIGSATLELK